MCAVFSNGTSQFQPGDVITVNGPEGVLRRPWVSWARSEKMKYWTRDRGGVPVDIPATAFAERSRTSWQLVWQELAGNQIIRGLLAAPRNHQEYLLKPEPECYIVTRPASEAELNHFGHDRLPFLDSPAFPIP